MRNRSDLNAFLQSKKVGDIFTNPLPKDKFEYLIGRLGVIPSSIINKREDVDCISSCVQIKKSYTWIDGTGQIGIDQGVIEEIWWWI